jgi:3-oxoacyl-[acyl-carrier protein] reductase
MIVIVSGASRGLGLASVKALLDAGYQVACCSTTLSEEIKALQGGPQGSSLFWQALDMADTAGHAAFITEAQKAFAGEKLWGLVNNAGMAVEGILSTLPLPDIERLLAVNLTGAIALTRAFLRPLLKQGGAGRIISISSITGLRGYTGLSVYAASKAGLDGFSRALSREVGRRGITVNTIAPGYMKTALSQGLDDKQLDQIVRRTPLNRLCDLDDVTPLLLFLLSQQASFISGQTLVVDGGLTS